MDSAVSLKHNIGQSESVKESDYKFFKLSRFSSVHKSNVICKYSTNNVQFSQSELSIAESCLSHGKIRTTSKGVKVPMRISSLRRETKTAQTLSIVVGGFIACWLPFFIYYLLMPFLPNEWKYEKLMAYLTWLGWFNSAINPFIYAFYSADFRLAFWRLTLRKFCKNRNNLSFLKA